MKLFTIYNLLGFHLVKIDFRVKILAGDIDRMNLKRSFQCARYYNSNLNDENSYIESVSVIEYLILGIPIWIVLFLIIVGIASTLYFF